MVHTRYVAQGRLAMNGSEETLVRIGQLSARTGVSRDTLRYYERLGLLPKPARTTGGFRVYGPATRDRLRFIKQAQSVGLTLDEIHDLVTFNGQRGEMRCQRVRDLLAAKLKDLEAKLRELRTFRRVLKESLALCDRTLAQHANGECPVVASPARDGDRCQRDRWCELG